jgi:hypothetical protein
MQEFIYIISVEVSILSQMTELLCVLPCLVVSFPQGLFVIELLRSSTQYGYMAYEKVHKGLTSRSERLCFDIGISQQSGTRKYREFKNNIVKGNIRDKYTLLYSSEPVRIGKVRRENHQFSFVGQKKVSFYSL